MKTHYYTLMQTSTGRPFLKIEKSITGKYVFDGRNILRDFAKNTLFDPMPAEEMVYLLVLNSQQKLKGIFFVLLGTLDSAIVCPREILIRALLCGAASIIVTHNHPSGSVEMSEKDIRFYSRLTLACSYVGIKLLDFLVVGEKVAFKDENGIVVI